MGNRAKVLQDSMSRHNVTNLKLVNYNRKICNTEIFKVQKFGRENFDDSTRTRQIHQTFPPSKFCAIWYFSTHVAKCDVYFYPYITQSHLCA